jgi:sRNA-binding carbon storage regulator CsrA
MLVLSRKHGEFVLVFERRSHRLIGRIWVVETGGKTRNKIGFDFGPDHAVVRKESTQFAQLTADQMLRVPLGTVLLITE